MTVDYAHTRRAEQNRTVKARALAAAAREQGVLSSALGLGAGGRRSVRLAAGYTSVSEDTWFLTIELLAVDEPAAVPARPVGPQARPCASCGVSSARLYLTGWRCDQHSPAALAGRSVPVPPPAAAGPARADDQLVRLVLDDAVLTAARRRTSSAIDRAAIATQAYRKHGHAPSARGP